MYDPKENERRDKMLGIMQSSAVQPVQVQRFDRSTDWMPCLRFIIGGDVIGEMDMEEFDRKTVNEILITLGVPIK